MMEVLGRQDLQQHERVAAVDLRLQLVAVDRLEVKAGRLQLLLADIVNRHGRANLDRDHEVQPSVDDLLVPAAGLEDVVDRQVSNRWQRTKLRNQLHQRLTLAFGKRAAGDGQVRGRHHPVGDRFTVTEATVLRHRLERVADGVAEVQRTARS